MNEKIRVYVNELFENAPNTKKVNDLKDEIISNANDKFNDLISDGKSEKEAYDKVIQEIGNVDELISEVEKETPIRSYTNDDQRRKTALIVSISVGLYFLALISCVVLDELNMPDFVTVSALLSLAGVPTCLLIYHFMSKPKYSKYEETMVEEFKEWKGKKNKDKEVKKALNSIVWSIAVILYILISFTFRNWHISWIIFIIACLVENIISLIFKLQE